MLDFEILQGESTPFPDKSLGHGPTVVLRLVQTLPQGSSVYFDRYFTTLPLLEKLSDMKIEGTGTLQANRVSKKDAQFRNVDLSKERQNHMKRGEYDEYTRDDNKIALVMWKDNKAILMGSTTSGGDPVTDVKRWDKKQKKYVDVCCPSVVKKYNSNMGGIDFLDQMMEYYKSWIRTKTWPVKVILHFFDLSIVNSWFEYKLACQLQKVKNKDQLGLLAFRMSIAEFLMAGPTRKRSLEHVEDDDQAPLQLVKKIRALVSKPSADMRFDGYNHWPSVDELKNPHISRLEGCSSRSRTRCTKCNVYLCLSKNSDCFVKFHTVEK